MRPEKFDEWMPGIGTSALFISDPIKSDPEDGDAFYLSVIWFRRGFEALIEEQPYADLKKVPWDAMASKWPSREVEEHLPARGLTSLSVRFRTSPQVTGSQQERTVVDRFPALACSRFMVLPEGPFSGATGGRVVMFRTTEWLTVGPPAACA